MTYIVSSVRLTLKAHRIYIERELHGFAFDCNQESLFLLTYIMFHNMMFHIIIFSVLQQQEMPLNLRDEALHCKHLRSADRITIHNRNSKNQNMQFIHIW